MRLAVRCCFAAVLAQSACSNHSAKQVSVTPLRDHYSVTLHSRELRGWCYSPQSLSPNGSLVIENFPSRKQVHIERVTPDKIERVRDFLALPRVPTTGDAVTIDYPKDSVLQHPSYVQLPIFDCRATPTNPAPDKNLFLLSAVVDLP